MYHSQNDFIGADFLPFKNLEMTFSHKQRILHQKKKGLGF
jgi:hypothetical protein